MPMTMMQASMAPSAGGQNIGLPFFASCARTDMVLLLRLYTYYQGSIPTVCTAGKRCFGQHYLTGITSALVPSVIA
ncbi:MAG: hypothetical protein ACK4SX_13870 [Alcanivoracaceae bacterium]